jgi:dynein heavy chain 2
MECKHKYFKQELKFLGKEVEIVVQALRLNTLSKLTFSDSVKFDALIRDVFLGVAFNNEGYEDLKKAIRDSYEELELKVNENQIRKVVELYEQLQQRMGVVIVGPSGSGKTTLFTLLKHAMSKMGRVVKQVLI